MIIKPYLIYAFWFMLCFNFVVVVEMFIILCFNWLLWFIVYALAHLLNHYEFACKLQ
jgi:hypothetical protein